jgi:hypothetical protein
MVTALLFTCGLLGEAPMSTESGHEKAAGAAAHGHFRASHADREQVIETLKAAFIQGRLTKDELELRVGQTLASRTYAELAALTGDIPAGATAARPPRTPARARRKTAKVATCVGLALALIAAAVFSGPGDGAERLVWLAIFFLPVGGLAIGGLLLFHSWLENRARRQLPQGPAGSRGGPASQRAAPVTRAGTLPPIGQAPPHTAEAAPRRRPTTAIDWVTVAASTAPGRPPRWGLLGDVGCRRSPHPAM